MKTLSILLAALVLGGVGVGATGLESEYFVKTIHIARIYPHPLGYKVVYVKGSLDIAETFLPLKWFSSSAGSDGVPAKGAIIWGMDATMPYMSVFWKDGKFSHVRLYLKRNLADLSWGTLASGIDISKEFEVEEPKLEF